MRDVLEYKQWDKLPYCRKHMQRIFNDVHRHIKKKGDNYKHELEFTSQDLRELAQAIGDTIKRWDTELNPEKNIKRMKKENLKDRTLDLEPYLNRSLPIMTLRRDFIQELTELRSLMEHHSVYLYFLEEASNDEFALRCTERFK